MKLKHAPWTDEEVQNLKDWQACPHLHPFTSAKGTDLIPTSFGWVEEEGGPVVQDWALEVMTDGSWKKVQIPVG